MFAANLVPGQGFQKLEIWRKSPGMHPSGRPVSVGYSRTGRHFYALVGDASQREIGEWRQNGHPITHRIVQYGAVEQARATDYLVSPEGRFFYVQGRREPGNLGLTAIYYAEERRGLDEQYCKPSGSGDPVEGEADTGADTRKDLPGGQRTAQR